MSDEAAGIRVLAPEGTLDAARVPRLDAALRAAIATRPRGVVIDLAAVRMLPSTAVGVLIAAAQDAREAGARLVLAGASPLVRGTLRTMGVDAILPHHVDVAAARRALGDDPPQ